MIKFPWHFKSEEKQIHKLKNIILKLVDKSDIKHRDLFDKFVVNGKYDGNVLTKATEQLIHEHHIKLTGTDTYSKSKNLEVL